MFQRSGYGESPSGPGSKENGREIGPSKRQLSQECLCERKERSRQQMECEAESRERFL